MNAIKTQRELAEAIGCGHCHLNAILRRRIRPSVDLAKRIEKATGTHWTTWFDATPQAETSNQPPDVE